MEPPHRATQRPIVLSLFELSPASFVIAFVTPLVSESRLAVGARVLFSISISPRSSPSSSATRKILRIKRGRNRVCRHQWRENLKRGGKPARPRMDQLVIIVHWWPRRKVFEIGAHAPSFTPQKTLSLVSLHRGRPGSTCLPPLQPSHNFRLRYFFVIHVPQPTVVSAIVHFAIATWTRPIFEHWLRSSLRWPLFLSAALL